MMKSTTELPAGYEELQKIDLVNNKREMIIVNVFSLLLAGIVLIVGVLIKGIHIAGPKGGIWVMCLGTWIYIILHELLHGIFMKLYSGAKVKYGFTIIYAYAGSDAYFCKKHYIIIALAPVVIWGIVLAILNMILPSQWFWPFYVIQIVNISGAAGDMYVSWIMSKMPENIFVRDTGTDMTVYGKRENE